MTKNSVSRRNWMGRGAAGASMAAVSLAGKAAAQSFAPADDAGLKTYNVRPSDLMRSGLVSMGMVAGVPAGTA